MADPKRPDAEAFRAFEHAGWEKVSSQYDRHFRDLTSQTVGPLLDSAGVRRGTRVLDVATGPGIVAAAAAARGATVIGLDFATSQVALARQRYPALRFVEGDAESLTFADESFDAVVINFGVMHFPNPDRALSEATRVLGSRGRIAFTAWAAPERAIGLGITLRAIQRLGDMNIDLPPGPPFFRFSDPKECRKVLAAVGLQAPQVQEVAQTWRLPSPDRLFDAIENGTVRTSALLRAQRPETREAIRFAMREEAAAYQKDDGCEIPMLAILASATRA